MILPDFCAFVPLKPEYRYIKDSLLNAKTLNGSFSFAYLPNYAPPTRIFTYSSNDDTNDIGYYLGATKYNSTYQNIHNRGEVVVTASSYIDIRVPWGIYWEHPKFAVSINA